MNKNIQKLPKPISLTPLAIAFGLVAPLAANLPAKAVDFIGANKTKNDSLVRTLTSADGSLTATYQYNYTTADPDPDNRVVTPGTTPFDGVADLIIDNAFRCTGSLLTGGRHILTAAHCLTDDSGNLTANNVQATWMLPSGNVTLGSNAFSVHPGWTGDIFIANDLAIITLPTVAPADVPRYDIYTNTDEVGQVADKTGYGSSGTGATGDTLPSGTKREGDNLYDDLHDTMAMALGLVPNVNYTPGAVLQYDFDNGLAANDAFGVFFGNAQLGQGLLEVNSAPGDSGGPSYIDGKIAGITSYGLTFLDSGGSDIDSELNSSFGEFSGDTRVSVHKDWIYQIVGVPEPGTVLGLLAVSGLGLGLKRKKQS